MNKSQLKLSEIIHEIIKNENSEMEEYYGVVIDIYKNIDKYLDKLDDINDKIYLAQWCNNYDKVKELKKALTLSEYEKNKYLQLKEKNIEIDETINFKILNEKYEFLDNIMDMITADSDIQDQILSLSDSMLKVFKKMYLRLQTLTDYYNPYIEKILERIGYVSLDTAWKNQFHIYDDLLNEIEILVSKGYELNEKEIDTLLYLCTSSIQHTIPNYNEMTNFGRPDTIDNIELEEDLKKAKQEKNIEYLKFAILATSYGIDLHDALEICERFDIDGIKITKENKDVLEMYIAIYRIINENDPEVLIELYDEFTNIMKPEKDFRRSIVFENDLRKTFAHDLNRQIYKCDNKSYTEIDGIKIYDAGTDFKMIVTAIGAYQSNFKNQENYFDYWNSPQIRSHGNCCSLIGKNNLSMASAKNVILGFSTMSDNMLLLSGSSDINSTPDSKNFNLTKNRIQKYMIANKLLDNTRGDYNELVYERRDLNSNPKFYKKNPDYIVFIEEYEDFNLMFEKYKNNSKKLNYLKKQKQLQDKQWNESIKAAQNFNIPIVKINREKVCKSELSKIQEMVEEFKSSKNSRLINKIITRFESNRVGNSGHHAPLQTKLFSKKIMDNILDEIKETINQEPDLTIKNNLYMSLYDSIVEEEQKVKACRFKRNRKQSPSIDFTKELKELEQILTSNNIDNHKIRR